MTIDNRSLDTRLNALDNVNADLDQATKAINPDENVQTALDATVPYTTQGDEMADPTSNLPDETDPTFTGEKIDVAINLKKPIDVVKKIITKTVKDVTKDIDQPLVTPGKIIEKNGKLS